MQNRAGNAEMRGLSRHLQWNTGVFLALGILTVGAVLRLWRLSWGLAESAFFLDEGIWLHRAARFVPLSWESFDFRFLPGEGTYPVFFGYLTGLTTAAAHVLGFTSQEDPVFSMDVILIARAISVGSH